MDQLSNELKKLGFSDEQVKQVLGVVTNFLQSKLPANVMAMLGNMQGASADAMSKVQGVAGDAANQAQTAADKAQNLMGGLLGKK